MNEIELPFRGWAKGTVPVMHAPDGDATVLELRCPLGNLKVYGLVDTPDHLERGEELCGIMLGRQRIRGIVPRKYTHVQIVPSIRSPGFVWWRLGYRPASSLPELQGSVSGGHSDVLRYSGPPATVLLEVPRGFAHLTHHPSKGHHQTSLEFANAPFRGQIKIPGPGLIAVYAAGSSWTLTLPE